MQASRFGPYALCGWKVLSDFELPELPMWQRERECAEESLLRIEAGAVPVPHVAPTWFAVTAKHEVTISFPEAGTLYLAPDGRRVVIQAKPESDPITLRNYLYGSVLATLCYLRGRFPLHGSAVLLHGSALIFSGPSGAGKSTLACAATQHGYPLLCDDVCAIDLQDPAHPLLWPTILRIKLLSDVVDQFHLGPATAYTRATRGEKGHFGLAELTTQRTKHSPSPIAAIYLLDADDTSDTEFLPLHGKDAFSFWMQQAHRSSIAKELSLQNGLFCATAALSRSVPVYRLRHPRKLNAIGDIITLLEKRHARSKVLQSLCEEVPQ